MATVYLDTSVISALHDSKNPDRQKITVEWFGSYLKKYDVFISPVVVEEIVNNDEPLRTVLLGDIRNLDVLTEVPGIQPLADLFLLHRILPAKSTTDALHLSYAVVFEMDYLASWNFKHLANVHRQTMLNRFNLDRGLFIPRLVSPSYLF